MRIDLITKTGLTASDGTLIPSGATIKFQTVFQIGTTDVKIYPKIYKNREYFESGYTSMQVSTETLPDDITLRGILINEFYQLTPEIIYGKVRDYLNSYYGNDIIELIIIN